MRKRCEGYRNQSPALPSRASCSRCFMALNPIVPIRKRKKKSRPFCNFFAISNPRPPAKDEKIPPNSKFAAFLSQYRHLKKSQQPLIEKKVAERARFLFSKRADRCNRPVAPAGSAVTVGCRSRRRCSKVVVAASGAAAGSAAIRGCLSGVISVAGSAATGVCRSG